MGLVVPSTPASSDTGRKYPLSTPLWRLSREGDVVTLDLATRGIVCKGQSGGGKSYSVGIYGMETAFAAGHSAVVLVTKATTVRMVYDAARATGRLQDVEEFSPDKNVFNWTEYVARAHGGSEQAVIPEIVEVITTGYGCVQRTSGSGGGEQSFWNDSRDILFGHAAFVDLQAHGGVDLQRVLRIIQQLATSPQCVEEPRKWYSLETLEAAKKNTPPSRRFELNLARQYFEEEVTRWSDKTRTSVQLCATTVLNAFLSYPLIHMLSGQPSTITPDDVVDRGKILIVNLPYKQYYKQSKILGCLMKLAVQRKLDRRLATWTGDPDLMIPCWIICDDGHAFSVRSDIGFQSTAREARCVSLFLTQGISSIRNELGAEGGNGDSLVGEYLMNHACKFFCCNDDHETNEAASRLIGEHDVRKSGGGTNKGKNGERGETVNQSSNWSTMRERWFKPEEFRALRMGGPSNDHIVDVVVVLPGVARFKANQRPYLVTQFHQKGPGLKGPPDPITMWRDKAPTTRIWVDSVPWWKIVPFDEWADFWMPNGLW